MKQQGTGTFVRSPTTNNYEEVSVLFQREHDIVGGGAHTHTHTQYFHTNNARTTIVTPHKKLFGMQNDRLEKGHT